MVLFENALTSVLNADIELLAGAMADVARLEAKLDDLMAVCILVKKVDSGCNNCYTSVTKNTLRRSKTGEDLIVLI